MQGFMKVRTGRTSNRKMDNQAVTDSPGLEGGVIFAFLEIFGKAGVNWCE